VRPFGFCCWYQSFRIFAVKSMKVLPANADDQTARRHIQKIKVPIFVALTISQLLQQHTRQIFIYLFIYLFICRLFKIAISHSYI